MTKFFLRKIRKGRVKVKGRWFRPTERHRKYDGRLDGMVYAFGVYPPDNNGKLSLALWGTKEVYEASKKVRTPEDEEEYLRFCETYKRPEMMEDGGLPWEFWKEESDGR